MIDIHCHLLPGIDDGAISIEQSLELARHAVADGITHMVVTPHIQPGVYDNNVDTISQAYDLFVAALEQHAIGLKVAMAAEIRLCPEIIPMLAADELPLFLSVEGKRTILLELPHSHVPPGTDQMIGWLMRQDINILIAHPERNKELMSNYRKLAALKHLGCQFQLTAGSIAGRFGEQVRVAAEYILGRGWCDLLASDAHNLNRRPPQLSDGQTAAAAIIGSEAASRLVRELPKALVGGMFST